MKNLFLLLLFISGASLCAQVTSRSVEFDKSNFDALQITIDADYEVVADVWEDFWEERYDVDFDKLDKDRASIALKADQASVPIISQKNADLFSKIGGTKEKATVSFAVTFTENDVVTRKTHAKSYDASEAIMTEFRTFFYTRYFDEKLEKARKELDDTRDDSSDDSKDAAKARRKIEKYEDKIEKLKSKIEDERREVGDELESAEMKARKAKELQERVRELEKMRARYLG